MQTAFNILSKQLNLPVSQVQKTITLLQEGTTIPFIARYRKEQTGSLDEVQIGSIQEAWEKFQELEKRKLAVIKAIEEQGKLTGDLRTLINTCSTLITLEDLYLPYKLKRKTRAGTAREKGLQPLAESIMKQLPGTIRDRAKAFISKEVTSIEDALQGARDIIAEMVNEDLKAREAIRNLFEREALLQAKVVKSKKEDALKYKDYFEFSEKLSRCPSHRLLAILRGEEEGFLRVTIGPDEEKALLLLQKLFIQQRNEAAMELELSLTDCYKRLLNPSVENEFRHLAKEKADKEAILVFADNLKQLLLAPPLGPKRVLAIDPGFRTGCKVVCLDAQGSLLKSDIIFPHEPMLKVQQASNIISSLIKTYNIEAIAIGNATAGRETETFIRSLGLDEKIQIYMVNESGASVYSASAIAREEFPDEDITVRGAVSIGRRLMDPLAELVKIDPKAIGVGQYQHDVDQVKLKNSLDAVVESAVNKVGVNLNTASKHLLAYVSGIGPQLAENIVLYRKEKGRFLSREQLKKVPRLGGKAHEQCAGFLRIKESDNPLDNTAVHPESYALVEQMAKDVKASIKELIGETDLRKKINLHKYINETIGLPTLQDIMEELSRPGRDPRENLKTFEFASGITKPEHLYVGMKLQGIVTNITQFGAFVEIGVKQDGLVHISNLANTFVSNPSDVVKLNQHVEVTVIEVDLQRKRIALSMK
jgi:uncharacterized protein